MSDLHWTNITVKLGDLKPWDQNPRTSSKAQAKRILASFEKFGQPLPVCIGPDAELYDGHQRLSALLTIHGRDYEIEARQSSRPLTDDERRALVLALANATGSWNWEQLSGWSTADLHQWGFDQETLRGWNMDALNLREMLNGDAEPIDPMQEWEGMPEFEMEDKFDSFVSIKVHFATPQDLEDFAILINQKLTDKTKSTWYPSKPEIIKEGVAINES